VAFVASNRAAIASSRAYQAREMKIQKKKQNKKIDEEEEEGKPGFPCGLTFHYDNQVCLRFPASFDLSATLS
jgi:hypothetical protein